MTIAKSLLDRLAADNPRAARSDDERSVRDAVRRHLQILLNARRNYAPACPGYGIGDFTELFRDQTDRTTVEEDIRRAIERFEPRLEGVWVDMHHDESDPLTIRFEIRGSITYGDKKVRADFVSMIDPSGAMKIE